MLNLEEYRLHTQNQLIILDDMKLLKITVDNITQLGLRPPELRQLFNKLGYYYCWFVIPIKVKIGDFHNKIKSDLSESFLVYGL